MKVLFLTQEKKFLGGDFNLGSIKVEEVIVGMEHIQNEQKENSDIKTDKNMYDNVKKRVITTREKRICVVSQNKINVTRSKRECCVKKSTVIKGNRKQKKDLKDKLKRTRKR